MVQLLSIEVKSNKPSDLYYQDRIKADGGIDYLKTIPDHQIINKTQYPDNPTLLEFRIDPADDKKDKFDANGIARINIRINQERGKFGPHIPYDTDLAIMTVDFSRLELFLVLNSINSMTSKLFLGSKAPPGAKTGIR